MKKLLALAVIASAFAVATPAHAIQDLRAICNEDSCAGVKRCYNWTDYPTCIYPWPLVP
ncbi:MAG TPA: hypothetical protein VGX28_01065 [Frankiaceae bacterium]|nr:hypothetical protein [Frankiaceae bacterium]